MPSMYVKRKLVRQTGTGSQRGKQIKVPLYVVYLETTPNKFESKRWLTALALQTLFIHTLNAITNGKNDDQHNAGQQK